MRIVGKLSYHRDACFDRILMNIAAYNKKHFRIINHFGVISTLVNTANVTVSLGVVIAVSSVDTCHNFPKIII